MKISAKLIVFYIAVLVVFGFMAFTLVSELHSLSGGYDALLRSPVRQMEQARVVQVDFKKQVQEWKDILLRGHNPDDLAKYTRQFHDKEEAVRAGAQLLSQQVQDAEARHLLEQFLAAHLVLSQKYQLAYVAYVAGNADFKAADKIVRGQDRAPTDLFDQVVQHLGLRVQESVAAQAKAAVNGRNLALGVAGGLLLLLGGAGFFLVRDILGRLSRLKTVSDRLARADLSGLAIDISGDDEISAFGESMKGIHAALEELLLQVSSQTTINI
jgi:methyl-accepting chemotaxis protein